MLCRPSFRGRGHFGDIKPRIAFAVSHAQHPGPKLLSLFAARDLQCLKILPKRETLSHQVELATTWCTQCRVDAHGSNDSHTYMVDESLMHIWGTIATHLFIPRV